MSVSGKDLADKLRGLMQELRITPEILNETCKQPIAQPFLKWFCENIGPENILQKNEIQLKKSLQSNGTWLTGENLDTALAEATKDYPELLRLVESKVSYESEVAQDYTAEKTAYDSDVADLNALKNHLATLTKLENQLDKSIKKEEKILEKIVIEENKYYHDCSQLMEEFDSAHREIYHEVEGLVKVYGGTIEEGGSVIAWTQVPLDLFIKQMETYNNYIQFYKKREFAQPSEELPGHLTDSATDDSNVELVNERAIELLRCQMNLIHSTLGEISAKADRYSYETVAAQAVEIYNDGNLKTPQTESQFTLETTELRSQRDLLEESNRLLHSQLKECVENCSKFEIEKILVEHGEARLERKKKRLEKFNFFLHLVRDFGHAHSDLLSILILLQQSKLEELVQFISEVRDFFYIEHTLSSKRCAIIQEIQREYEKSASSSLCERNVFYKLFSTMIIGDDNSPDAFNLAIQRYDQLITENQTLLNELLHEDLDTNINNLKPLEDELMTAYHHEINSGVTSTFKVIPYNQIVKLDEAIKGIENAQSNVNNVRNKIKNMLSKINRSPLEREKTILWQRFLADPDYLKDEYEKGQREIDSQNFVQSLDC